MTENPTNFLLDTSVDKKADNSESKESSEYNTESQFYCDALTEDNINEILVDTRPELIVLLGLNDFGKSTFAGSIYHLLRTEREMGDYSFVDSDTFSGFERRVFLRKCNKNGTSDVKRTIRGQGCFLTIHLENKKTKEKRSIILSDKSGETYRDYISKEDVMRQDKSLKQANRILFFVNTEELISKSYGSMKDNMMSLLRRFKTNNMIPTDAVKYIVFNKYDKVPETQDLDMLAQRKEVMTAIIEEHCGASGLESFCINSKNIVPEEIDEDLKKLFMKLITPLNVDKNKYNTLDWVNSAVNKIKENGN